MNSSGLPSLNEIQLVLQPLTPSLDTSHEWEYFTSIGEMGSLGSSSGQLTQEESDYISLLLSQIQSPSQWLTPSLTLGIDFTDPMNPTV